MSGSESRVQTEELTYALSNGESGNKRKDSDRLHGGEGREGGSSGERATEFDCIISLRTTCVERRRNGAVKEGKNVEGMENKKTDSVAGRLPHNRP